MNTLSAKRQSLISVSNRRNARKRLKSLAGESGIYADAYNDLAEDFYSIPAADVAPVVHGRWDDSGRYTLPGGSTAVRCTKCGCALTESEYHLQNWNYCPVCGAKMDGGGSDEAD